MLRYQAHFDMYVGRGSDGQAQMSTLYGTNLAIVVNSNPHACHPYLRTAVGEELLDHIDVLDVPAITGITTVLSSRTIRLLRVEVIIHLRVKFLLRLPRTPISSAALLATPLTTPRASTTTLAATARPSTALAASAWSGAARSAGPVAVHVLPASRTSFIVAAAGRQGAAPVAGDRDAVSQRATGHDRVVEGVAGAGRGAGRQESQMDGLACFFSLATVSSGPRLNSVVERTNQQH